jgi:glycosyltransferase involved in cell wall biosynthesis
LKAGIGRPVIEVYSSVGGGAFFERMLREWESCGAEVDRCHSVDEAEYRRRHGAAGRLALRWRMYGAYSWKCFRRALRPRNPPPIRVVTTNPFYAPAIVAKVAGKRGSTINLLYDLFPEALIQAGRTRPDSRLSRTCAATTRFALRQCQATVFLGDRLRAYAEATYGPARRAAVIAVGADGLPFREHPPLPLPPDEMHTVLYSGVMGKMHDVETVASVLPGAGAFPIRWVFHAMGSGYSRLRARCGTLPRIQWGDPLPDSDWRRAMRSAAIALVTIAPGAERVVMPSKTYSALVAGQAILAVCPRQSDLADLVSRHDCGWVVEPGASAELEGLLARIASSPAEVLAKRQNAFAAGHRLYDMEPIARTWWALFEEMRPQ